MYNFYNFLCGFYIVILINNQLTIAQLNFNNNNHSVIFNQSFKSDIAQRKCQTYITKACNGTLKRETDDLVSHTLVVGGRPASPQEFPHMALIGYGNLSDVTWACGGTLISEKYVLSAAHCSSSSLGNPNWIRLGDLDHASTTDDANPQDFKILQTILHPDYHPPVVYNDIALFRFQGISQFSNYIRPICLHTFHALNTQSYSAVGWGATGYGEVLSTELMTVNLSLEDSTICDNVLSGDALPYGFNDTTMICAGDLEGGKDTCQGDSGGPFQLKLKDVGCDIPMYSQTGIVSYGIGCGFSDTAAIYTKVSFYVPWIEKIVWGSVR